MEAVINPLCKGLSWGLHGIRYGSKLKCGLYSNPCGRCASMGFAQSPMEEGLMQKTPMERSIVQSLC